MFYGQTNPPVPKSQAPTDLYPELDRIQFSPKTANVMRQNGLNPTQFQQRFDKAHATGDYATKAKLAEQYALISDRVSGGNGASMYLDSMRAKSADAQPIQTQPVMNSVSGTQGFFGSIHNGFVDMAEAVPQLLVSGAGLTGIIDKQQWDKAHKGIEDTFAGMKTYVSQDYQKPLVSYSDKDGFNTNLDFKTLVGTTGNLMSYILPGLLTGGAGTLATVGSRAALRGAVSATDAAVHLARLTKAGKLATQATGLSSFLQTFPAYQREALASGLNIHDATLFAIPVAGLNAVIETANMGPLTKALGISPKAAQAAVRRASLDEATKALTGLANKDLTHHLLMETGQQAVKNALGVITDTQKVNAFSKFVSGLGGRVKRGFLEQGIPEGGEEFFQSIVENGSKELYNNLAGSDSTGRFQDKSFGGYAFDALYGTALGALVGTLPGTFLQSKQADPTVFGHVAANVRQGLRKGITLDQMINPDPANPNRLPIFAALDHKLATEQNLGGEELAQNPDAEDVRFTPEIHADLVGKVSRMAKIAHDFADVQAFNDGDRKTMFDVNDAQNDLQQKAQQIDGLKAQYGQLTAQMNDPNADFSQRAKAQISRGLLDQQLGKLVDSPGGSGQVFEAEQRQQQRASAVQNVVDQAMKLYANDTARPVINKFVADNLIRIDRENGAVSYPDDFTPKHILNNAATGDSLVTDESKLLFRKLTRQGGTIIQPAMIDENGEYQPSVYEPQNDTYASPVDNLDTHLQLASSLAERGGMAQTQSYRKPDNSVEGAWLRDGQQLVADLQTIQGSKGKGKKAALAQTQKLASAYLQSSGFLAENERYADEYANLATALHAQLLQTNKGASTSEADALPIGENVDLLAEGTPSPISEEEYADFVDNNRISPQRLASLADKVKRGEAITDPKELALFSGKVADIEQAIANQPTTDESNLPQASTRSRPVSAPFDLSGIAQQSPAPEPDFADELQGTVEQEQRRDAGEQLQKATGELAAALGDAESDAVAANERILRAVEQANSAITAELEQNADPVAQQPTDEGTVSPADSLAANDVIQPPVRSRRQAKPTFAQSFVPTDLQGAILSFFARNNKINQADFDRVAGAKMRIGAGGGNPYFKYLDPANRQQPLDTLARSIAESIGQPEVDQQSVEQAIVDAVTTFRKGNGPSQQLLEKYSEPEQLPAAENDAALDDALDSLPEADRAVWEASPDALEALQDDIAELVDQYSEEEINRLADSLFIHGYVDEHGQVDTDALITDLPAIESGLLDFEPAGIDLYQRMRESVIFAQSQIAPILDAARERVSQFNSQQISPSVSENGNVSPGDAQPVPIADEFSQSGSADPTTSAGRSTSPLGSPAESPSSTGAERAVERVAVEQELVSIAASDPRTADVTASFDIALADNQKQIESKQREIEGIKKDLQKRTATGHRGSGKLFADSATQQGQTGTNALARLREQAASQQAQLSDGYVSAPNSPGIVYQFVNGEAVATGSLQNGQFVAANTPLDQKGTAAYADVQALKKRLAQVGKLRETLDNAVWVKRLAQFVDRYGQQKATELLRSVPGGGSAIQSLLVIPTIDLGKLGQATALEDWLVNEAKSAKQAKKGKPQADLFAGETSGLDAEQSAKNAIAQKETELSALVAKQADLQQQKLRAIETAVEAAEQQTELFERPTARRTVESEKRIIERSAKQAGLWLKAPNGQPTKLTPEQWVVTRTDAFANWFGDWLNDPANASKVLDENGEPLIVHRGDVPDRFTFDSKQGVYFASSQNVAEGYSSGGIYQTFLSIKQPFAVNAQSVQQVRDEIGSLLESTYDMDDSELSHDNQFQTLRANYEAFRNEPGSAVAHFYNDFLPEIDSSMDNEEARDVIMRSLHDFHAFTYEQLDYKDMDILNPYLSTLGYDGVVREYDKLGENNGLEFVVFTPTQIKSATQNTGLFDATNPDIRFQLNESRYAARGEANTLAVDTVRRAATKIGDSPLSRLADRLAESFGVDIVTDPDAYRQAIEQSGALKRTKGREPIAFRYQGKIYLSPQANANSLLHEAGGMLAELMCKSDPALFKRGVDLVRQSGYLKRIQQDSYYRALSAPEQEIEALETAIGDLGAQFVVDAKRKGFRQWLADAWKAIRQALGFTTETPIEQMTLGEFVQKAVGDLLSGNVPSMTGKSGNSANQTLAFQLGQRSAARQDRIYGQNPQALTDFANQAENFYRDPKSFAASDEFFNVSRDLWNLPVNKRTSVDKKFIEAIGKATGWKLSDTKPATLEYTRLKNFFHQGHRGSGEASGVILDPSDIGASAEETFSRQWNAAGNQGFVFRQMVTKLGQNTNLNTFIHYLDDASGNLRKLITDVEQIDGLDADFIRNTLAPLREKAEAALAPFSTLLGNNSANVKTVTVTSYDFDENGNVIQVERTIPVAVAMSLAASTMTQTSSHGAAAGVVTSQPTANALYTKERNGRFTRKNYGEQWTNPDTGEVYHLLLDKSEMDSLINRFKTGEGGYTGEASAFAALRAFFNQQAVVDVLEAKANALNQGNAFERVITQSGEGGYFPIATISEKTDARAESRNRGATLDEARILLSRSGRAEAVRLSDPVSLMRSYQSSVLNVVAYGRLTENLTNLRNALSTHYRGPQKAEIDEYLEKRIDTLQNYTSKLAEKTENGVGAMLDKLMRQYGRAVLNSIGSPLKQLPTYYAARATNLIDAKYLNDSEVVGLLAKLSAGGYWDISVRGDIDTSGATDRGLAGATGGDTLERPEVEELLGLSIGDEDERLRHQKRWATVINRVLGSASQFIAGSQFEDYGLSTKNLNNVQKKLKQLDQFADRYFTSANQRTDRAVILAWKLAATKQGMAQGLSGEALDEYTANTVTKLMYETYSLSNLAERTPLSTSDNYLLKMLGLYSSQQQKIGNLLLRAVSDWSRAEPGTAEHTAALRQLWNVGAWSVLFNAVSVATVTSLARALMAWLSGDDRDDAKTIAQQIGWDSLRNITGTYPGIGSAAADYLLSSWDTIDSGGHDALVDFPALEVAQQGLDAINQTGTLLFTQDEQKSDKALDALVRTLPDLVAKTTGVPVNLKRVIVEHITTDKDDK